MEIPWEPPPLEKKYLTFSLPCQTYEVRLPNEMWHNVTPAPNTTTPQLLQANSHQTQIVIHFNAQSFGQFGFGVVWYGHPKRTLNSLSTKRNFRNVTQKKTANPMHAICTPPKFTLSHWLFFLRYVPFLKLRLVLKLSRKSFFP